MITTILQNNSSYIQEVIEGKRELKKDIVNLFILNFVTFAIFGFIIGASHSWLQALVSSIKVPILFNATLLITLPNLYIFYSLFGSKNSFLQLLTLTLVATCVIGFILIGFAPISIFFLLSSNSYHFNTLLNILFFAFSSVFGIKLLYQSFLRLPEIANNTQDIKYKFLLFWLFLYTFVGSQLSWILRPFFGMPNSKFEIFREMESNFYMQVIKLVFHLFKR
ncbi:MAG: actin-binding WH2 domain-containing protein [Leptospiraceae bacterium]|nr:hypothetical protein [Leptospiraceae bacterium]MCP5496956.1 actin-binding WH2 domain-containing protein [Leptospiraceae bacterium]